MSTRGPAFHNLPGHCQRANRPNLGDSGAMVSSRRYQYNGSPVAVNKFGAEKSSKNVSDTILIASRAGSTPLDTNPYMMTL